MARWLAKLSKMKATTPEQFDALVRSIEIVAQRNPAYYRRRLLILASLGYVYILAVSIGIYGLLWGLLQLSSYFQISANEDALRVITFWIAFGFLSRFFVRIQPPKGVPLTRKNAPALFATLDRLSRSLQAPRLHRVILTNELNAGIMQRPCFGFIGWQTNYLVVGLPLMQALSPQQFEAVMAHELAHLCGGDGKISAWIYRVRHTWYDLAERFEHSGQSNLLFKHFFSWYGPFFNAYSFVHARSQEYEADRRAAELVGVQHKAEALIWLNISESFLTQQFWPQYQRSLQQAPLKESQQEGQESQKNQERQDGQATQTPPANFITQQLTALRNHYLAIAAGGTATKQNRHWLSLHLAEQTSNASTHPCLTERLEALNYQIPAVLTPPAEAAMLLLAPQQETFVEAANKLWQTEQKTSWPRLCQYHQRQRSRLEALNFQPSLTIEERLKRALLIWKYQSPQASLPLLRELAIDAPEHTKVRYWLGEQLISALINPQLISPLNDEHSNQAVESPTVKNLTDDFAAEKVATVQQSEEGEGIEHLRFVIEKDPALAGSACYLLFSFYLNQGQAELAESFRQQGRNHEQLWRLANEERKKLNSQAQFIAPDLPTDQIEQLANYFATYPEIKAVYIARRVVERFPALPHYYIAITRHYRLISQQIPLDDNQLALLISAGLAFSSNVSLHFSLPAEHWHAIKRLQGSLIYQRSQQ
jgi:Zn-dependent protease with chaperone function